MATGVAQRRIDDLDAYQNELSARLDPVASIIQRVTARVRANPRKVVFAEGEEEAVIRAAASFQSNGLGQAVLVGRPDRIRETVTRSGREPGDLAIAYAPDSPKNEEYSQALYRRLQRQGSLLRDCTRLVTFDRNVFAASMVAAGDADAMVTGVTRNFSVALDPVRMVLDEKPGQRVIGVSMILARGRTVFVADTNVHDMPTAEELADISEMAAGVARRLGYEPRVALLAYSTFGYPRGERSIRVREAVDILEKRNVDFQFDGEMSADVALNRAAMANYPFCRLKDTANVLIMPAIHSASISTKLLQELGGCTVIGPLLVGLEKPVQICALGAKMSDIGYMAAIAAFDINR